MANINMGKVLVGGLAAGVVINVVESVMNLAVLAGPAEELLSNLGLDPVGGGAIGGYVALAFGLGGLMVWTYAAMRPRFGPGPGTAMKAGLVIWGAFYGLGSFSNWLMGIVNTEFLLITLGYSLVMMLGAAYVGSMLYKEE